MISFPGGPVGKNLPINAGVARLISGQGTQIPHALGQLSKAHEPQGRPSIAKKKKEKGKIKYYLSFSLDQHLLST